jgi:hypothetical protein
MHWRLGLLTFCWWWGGDPGSQDTYPHKSALPLPPAQVTKVKLEQKQREGIAEARSGRRSLVRPGLLNEHCLPPELPASRTAVRHMLNAWVRHSLVCMLLFYWPIQ